MSDEMEPRNLGLTAYAERINIDLFNEVIALVMEATTVDTAAVYSKLKSTHLWFSRVDCGNICERYGTANLGELLERISSNPGTDNRDMRSVALAVGYMNELINNEVLPENQKSSFLSKLKRMSVNDTYLKGALYLFLKNEDSANKLLDILTRGVYTRTEEIIFVLSLYDDFYSGFTALKPHLLRLLSDVKTIGVITDSSIYIWLIGELCYNEAIKDIRAKDMALFRAFMEIPTTFVKPGNKHHSVLLAHGYSEEEIVFLNSFAIRNNPTSQTLDDFSITAEKIAVETMVTLSNSGNALPPEAFDHMDYLLKKYSSFAIKISGFKGIDEAIKSRITPRDPLTFTWLYKKFSRKIDFFYDILENKWDVLSKELSADEYRNLFDSQLLNNAEQPKELLTEYISKYDELSGSSYLNTFEKGHDYGRENVFALLTDKGILNLMSVVRPFVKLPPEALRDEDGNRPPILEYVSRYLRGIHHRQSFDFFKAFFAEHNFDDMHSLFCEPKKTYGYQSRDSFFADEFFKGISTYRYDNSKMFDIKRSFLSEDEQKEFLGWLDDYLYKYKADKYIEFTVCLLVDPFVSTLVPHEELRLIFDMVINLNEDYIKNRTAELKRKYFTVDEQQAEADALKAKKLKDEQLEHERQIQEFKNELKETYDGTFASLLKYMDKSRYRYSYTHDALAIAAKQLDAAFKDGDKPLNIKEIGNFYRISGKLIKEGIITFAQACEYTSLIEEADEIAENN